MRRLLVFGLAVLLATASLPVFFVSPSLAQDGAILGEAPYLADGAVIAASGDEIVAAASVPSVDISSRSASGSFYYSYYTAQPDIGWNGSQSNCTPGTTSVAFKAAVIDRIAFYRAMAGVPSSVGLAADSSVLNQQAALMFSRNDQLSHAPSSSWACYTSSGAQAAGSSNIALGAYGVGAIDAYMKDAGGNNTAAGHRRWILFPQTQSFGTGDVPSSGNYRSANALWVWDSNVGGPRPSTRDGFVAWPSPGYVPYQVVYPRWTFSYPGAGFGSASVSLTLNGSNVPVSIDSSTTNGYGENTIVFRPNGMSDSSTWSNPGSDATYQVRITGVSVGGQSRTFAYDVTVFDPASNASNPTSTPAGTATPSGYGLGDSFMTTTSLSLRSGAGTSYGRIAVLPSGTIGQITGSPVRANGFTFYPVTVSGVGSGWAAGEYFSHVAPTPTATSSPTRTSTSIPTRTPTAVSYDYATGDSFLTTTSLSLRNGPGTSYARIAVLATGTIGQVTGSPVVANGYTFYPITIPGIGSGWAAGEYFAHVDSTPTSTALPTQTTTPTRTATRPPQQATSTPTRIPGGFLPGDTVRTTATVNFRTGPSTGYSIIATVPSNTSGTITGSPVVNGSYTWYPLTIPGVGSGWIASSYLALVSSGGPNPTATSIPTTTGGWGVGNTVYTTANLNIRSGPGTGYSIRGVAPKGTSAVITGIAVKSGSMLWYPLDVSGIGNGWASGTYLSSSPTVQGPQLPTSDDPTDEYPEADTPIPMSEPTITPGVPAEQTATPTEPATLTPTETEMFASTETLIAETTSTPTVTEWLTATPTIEPSATEGEAEVSPTIAVTDDPIDSAPAWLPIERIQRSPDSQPGQVLVDQDGSTVWFADGAGQPLAMFVLDLGQDTTVSRILWRVGDSQLSGTLYLAVSSDGENWTDLDPTLANVAGDGWTVLDAPVTTRYIRFAFVNDANAEWLGGISEVRILP